MLEYHHRAASITPAAPPYTLPYVKHCGCTVFGKLPIVRPLLEHGVDVHAGTSLPDRSTPKLSSVVAIVMEDSLEHVDDQHSAQQLHRDHLADALLLTGRAVTFSRKELEQWKASKAHRVQAEIMADG